jgi:reductive dehalogenase
MQLRADYGKILNRNVPLGPFPMERLKRVEQPTTRITDDVQRTDEREQGFIRAARGDFGPVAKREINRPAKHPIHAAGRNMTSYLAPRVDGEVASTKAPIPEDPEILSRHIKRLGYFFRANIIGIGPLPQYAVYTHDKNGNPVKLDHKFAIVILIDQDFETMDASKGYDWISGSQSILGYSNSAFIACIMADYIRKLGYPARAHHSANYQVAIPPLLLLAGIGEMSRMGNSVLNPFLGARFKASAVTTDLPLLPDKPIDFRLQRFCQTCKKCAVLCPSRAIPMGDKVMYNGYECWKLDIERCAKFRVTNQNGSSCGQCIKVCPWNKPQGWTHDIARWMAMHTPWLDSLLVKMDDIWGYGKQHEEKKWWFDLEEIDGVLQIPKQKRD